MLKIGHINEFTVLETCSEGFFLTLKGSNDSCDSKEKVLLPTPYAPEEVKIGQEIRAFTYFEDDSLIVATTFFPDAMVGEYALLEAVDVKQFGAFFDWGLDKDLLVPETEQRLPIRLDEDHIVRVCIDERTQKIYGTTKINKYIQESEFDIEENDEVEIEPVTDEELGFRCIINRKFIGMIYHNEIFQDIALGHSMKGIVKKIREDGLVDLALQVQGFKNLVNAQDKILAYLKQNDGASPLHDKSTPEEIQRILNMSKQTFKKTIGILYRSKQITIKKDGIELI